MDCGMIIEWEVDERDCVSINNDELCDDAVENFVPFAPDICELEWLKLKLSSMSESCPWLNVCARDLLTERSDCFNLTAEDGVVVCDL
jgi:hypothetical protein